jgi:hypothetical protein
MNCRSSVLETLLFMVRFLSYRALETNEKGRSSHQEQRPSPGDFVRKFILSRASAEKSVPNQTTVVISYPVGRPPLSRQPFLMLSLPKSIGRKTASHLFCSFCGVNDYKKEGGLS